ncbi:hypothetical protein AKI39_23200 [Bordetella sp. H567]|uniref:hypothetical protein n=1 Tax=Bordetella sp. H567 TaxID=1697043 RepID=UPI00081C5ED3|nr:hypothetical protein [Bordetella sp. H567]AOB33031.1 hypothetical protein AKI39_23200 [Bordetella sp. H567]
MVIEKAVAEEGVEVFLYGVGIRHVMPPAEVHEKGQAIAHLFPVSREILASTKIGMAAVQLRRITQTGHGRGVPRFDGVVLAGRRYIRLPERLADTWHG